MILKIFKKSVILDQSRVCISNGLKVTACQSEELFAKMHLFQWDCNNKFGKIFIQTDAISKRKKIAIPDLRQMNLLSKGFKMTYDF